MLQDVLLPAGISPARIEEVQLTEAITELVKAGLGVAVLARWAVQPLIDAGHDRRAAAHRPRTAPRLVRGDAQGPGARRLHPGIHRAAGEARADRPERQSAPPRQRTRGRAGPARYSLARRGWAVGAAFPDTPTAAPSDARRSLPPSSTSSFALKTITCATPCAAAVAQRVAAPLELRGRVRRQAVLLVVDPVGQPLMVEARRVDRLLRVHAEVDDVDDRLEHGVDDRPAARAAGDHEQLAVLGEDRRRHARQHPLARLGEVRLRCRSSPSAVVSSGPGIEVAHLVVQQEAGARHDDLHAIALLERVGHRHRVAVAVDDRDVRRLVAFVRPFERRRRRLRRLASG